MFAQQGGLPSLQEQLPPGPFTQSMLIARMPRPDPKSSRMLLVYCFLSTLFCLHFIHLAKQNARICEITTNSTQNDVSGAPGFPRKIWQTSKAGAAALENNDRLAVQSWLKLNQKHRYELITQQSSETIVRERFRHRADIQETFQDLQDPILRADLIRYLVLLAEGGVYSDLDTMCLIPIEDWLPPAHRDKVGLVIGIEYDSLGQGRWVDWSLDLQFATWAMLAKPGHLAMKVTVDRVVERLKKLAQAQATTVPGIKPSFRDILDTTGPAMFTEAVFESLSFVTGTDFTWHNVSGLQSAMLVADVLILPINAFGSGQQHSNSGSPNDDTALVHHMFKGSWKVEHPLIWGNKEENPEPEREKKIESEQKPMIVNEGSSDESKP